MSSVNGRAGQNSIPEDQNGKVGDHGDVSETKRSGTLRGVKAADVVGSLAQSVLQEGGATAGGLFLSSGSSSEASGILSILDQREYLDGEDLDGLDEETQVCSNVAYQLTEKLGSFCRGLEQLHLKIVAERKRSPSGSRKEAEISELVDQYRGLCSRARGLNGRAEYMLSAMSNAHKRFAGKTYEEVLERLGERGEEILGILSHLGLRYSEESNWHIVGEGSLPQCLKRVNELCAQLEKSVGLPEGEGRVVVDEETPEERISLCQSVFAEMRALWSSLLERLQTLYNRVVFFLLWILKRLQDRVRAHRAESSTPVFENPYAASFTQSQDRETSSSVRSAVSGRSDLSEEDLVRRPEDVTIEAQSIQNKDEDKGEDTRL